MFFRMGLVKMNGVRQYWEHGTKYSPVCDVMSRNRFRTILTMLHFVDNLSVSSEEKKDKLWNLRLFLNSLRSNFL